MYSLHTDGKVTSIHELRKNEKAKMRKRKNKTPIVIAFLLLFLFVLVLLFSPLLNITVIEVEGTNLCDNKDIINNCDIDMGENILRINKKEIIYNLREKFPYIDTVSLSRKLPNKIIIKITEREPVGMIAYMGSYVIVDKDGNALEVVDINSNRGLAVIEGVKSNRFQLGQLLPADNPEKFQLAVDIIKLLIKYNLLYKVSVIDVGNIENIHVVLGNNVVANISGRDNTEYKINYLNEIIKRIGLDRKGYINFEAGQNPIFIPQE